jgi:hypothetical protein
VLSCPPAFAGVNNRALRYRKSALSVQAPILSPNPAAGPNVWNGASHRCDLACGRTTAKKILIQIKTRESALTYTYRISQLAIRLRAVISI